MEVTEITAKFLETNVRFHSHLPELQIKGQTTCMLMKS